MRFKPRGSMVAVLATLTITVGVLGAALSGALALSPMTQKLASAPMRRPSLSIATSDIIAKAAVVYDPSTGTILFSKDSEESLPLASLTKLATAYAVLSEVSPSHTVTITTEDLQPSGNSGLQAGDQMSLSSLLKLGFIASSNDAMAAVASSLGPQAIPKINGTAQKLGLTHSVFYNPTGLDINQTDAGAYGSATDIAHLAAAFYQQYPQYFELTENPSATIADSGRTLTAKATAAPLLSTPNLIAVKTGYTTLAGGNLVAVFDLDIGHPLIAVVLGSTETGRFQDMKTLIQASRQTL